jgi:thiol:disulfide interchange protein DsbG
VKSTVLLPSDPVSQASAAQALTPGASPQWRRRQWLATAAAAGLGLSPAVAVRAQGQAAPPIKLAPEEAYALAAGGHGLSLGPLMAAHPVYVFFDTTCPHCAHLWQTSEALTGKLRFVWMPVGLLRPGVSLRQGATILAAANPQQAMRENETRVSQRLGGIPIANDLSEEVLGKVRANTQIFDKLGADSVPLMLYRHARTGAYGARAGSLDEPRLRELLGQ